MKSTKMIGAFALTAALAMGTVPAFAATSAPLAENDEYINASYTNTSNILEGSTGSATTEVEVFSVNSQINATIPVKVVVVVPSIGGDIVAPTAKAYQIKNLGDGDIEVTQAKETDGTDFKAAKEAAFAATSATNATKQMELKAADNGTEYNLVDGLATDGSENWSIAGKTNLGIGLSGSTNDLTATPLSAGNTGNTAVNIVYTVKSA